MSPPERKGADWGLFAPEIVPHPRHLHPREAHSPCGTVGSADYAEVVRMVRNLAHPARHATDHCRGRVTQKYLQRQFEVVLNYLDWLAERNSESLIERMKA